MINEIKEIADHYGLVEQTCQLVEEMAELTAAINHLRRNNSEENLRHVIEELADVELCEQQVVYLLKAREVVNTMAVLKIKRQLERIREENK